ncbi:MAG: NAD(P)H-binding protein, partial [Gemmatimonadaceae bacterium]|nr:NAD(P)H-binding protein [Acetobacteraceae bacterium]
MKVVIFGASGKTGTLVVEKAKAAGHTVTIFAHSGESREDGVSVVKGDAGDAEAVRRALAGQDAVIDTIGGSTPYKDTDLETSAARNILDGMKTGGAKRLIVISAMGVGDSVEQAPFWYEYLLLTTFLRGSTKDKTNMEAVVEASGVDFVIARPPMLSDDPETGSVRIVTDGDKAHKITRGDLAQFLVDQLQ